MIWNDVFGPITALEVIEGGAPTDQQALTEWLEVQYNEMYPDPAERSSVDFEECARQILRDYQEDLQRN